jgi:hypothetical protein
MVNFVGKFYGKYHETKVLCENDVETKKGFAVCTIKEVGHDAYLISVLEDETHVVNNLAYLEKDILKAESQNGSGVSSTYFECDGELVHKVSIKTREGLIVKIFKFRIVEF